MATSAGRICDEIPRILYDMAVLLGIEHPDAISVSEYLPGQGVGMHVDRAEAGPTIIGVSLLGAGVLRFQRDDERAIDIDYPRRAMMVMEGECRSLPWQHELLPVKERRISIVFRRAG